MSFTVSPPDTLKNGELSFWSNARERSNATLQFKYGNPMGNTETAYELCKERFHTVYSIHNLSPKQEISSGD